MSKFFINYSVTVMPLREYVDWRDDVELNYRALKTRHIVHCALVLGAGLDDLTTTDSIPPIPPQNLTLPNGIYSSLSGKPIS